MPMGSLPRIGAIVMAACLAGALAESTTAPAPAPAATSKAKVPRLPKKRIESVYRNGDLDSVIFFLRDGREKPMFLDKSDSILAFKYLGIIYATDMAKREKGRYYFNQMFRLDPGASITELIPGETARTVFKEAREEFFELNPGLAPRGESAPPPAAAAVVPAPVPAPAAEPAPAPAPFPTPAVADSKPHSHAVWWWIGGGVLAAGAAAGVTVAVLDPPVKSFALHD